MSTPTSYPEAQKVWSGPLLKPVIARLKTACGAERVLALSQSAPPPYIFVPICLTLSVFSWFQTGVPDYTLYPVTSRKFKHWGLEHDTGYHIYKEVS